MENLQLDYEEVRETILWIAGKWGLELKNSVSCGLDALREKGVLVKGTERSIYHWMIKACVEIGDEKNASILRRAEMEHDPIRVLLSKTLLAKFWGKNAANSIQEGLPIILKKKPGMKKALFCIPRKRTKYPESKPEKVFSTFEIMIHACIVANDFESAQMFRRIEKETERATTAWAL